jgi:hypothetical protein
MRSGRPRNCPLRPRDQSSLRHVAQKNQRSVDNYAVACIAHMRACIAHMGSGLHRSHGFAYKALLARQGKAT